MLLHDATGPINNKGCRQDIDVISSGSLGIGQDHRIIDAHFFGKRLDVVGGGLIDRNAHHRKTL